MADEEKTETEKSSKMQSRKFLVWLVWLIIMLIVGVIVLICCIRNIATAIDKSVDLFSAVLKDFFWISAAYLGVNFGQKAAFAISDALSTRHENEEGLQ